MGPLYEAIASTTGPEVTMTTATAMWAHDEIARLNVELREMRQILAILIRQGGGQMFVSDKEIVAVEREPALVSFRDDERDGVIIRA